MTPPKPESAPPELVSLGEGGVVRKGHLNPVPAVARDEPLPRLKQGHFFVANLDLLGLTELLKHTCGPYRTNEDIGAAMDALEEPANRVYWLRRAATALVKEVQSALATMGKKIPDLDSYAPRLQAFGDTTVLYMPFFEADGTVKSRMPGLLLCMNVTARLFLQSLARGFPIRGAVSVGVGTEFEPGQPFGQAFYSAHELERKAKTIRVIVGDTLTSMLDAGTLDAEDRIERWLVEEAKRYITTDTDGRPVLDYLGDAFRTAAERRGRPFAEEKAKAYSFLCKTAEKFNRSKNEDWARKYEATIDYFKRRGCTE